MDRPRATTEGRPSNVGLVAANQSTMRFSECNEAERRVGLGDRSAADRLCGMSQGGRPVPARGSDGPAGKAAGLPPRCGGRPAALDRKAHGPFRTRGTRPLERMRRTRPCRRGGSAVWSTAALHSLDLHPLEDGGRRRACRNEPQRQRWADGGRPSGLPGAAAGGYAAAVDLAPPPGLKADAANKDFGSKSCVAYQPASGNTRCCLSARQNLVLPQCRLRSGSRHCQRAESPGARVPS